jgi:hypothetical protein
MDQIRRNKAWFFVRDRVYRSKMWRWVKRSVAPLWRMAGVERLGVEVRMNLEDPAETGKVAGYVNALRYGLFPDPRSVLDVRFVPVFDRPCSDVTVDCTIATSISRLIYPLVVALLTFPYVATYKVNKRYRVEVLGEK